MRCSGLFSHFKKIRHKKGDKRINKFILKENKKSHRATEKREDQKGEKKDNKYAKRAEWLK